ncbi:DUF6542 domain-containing protein [Streptomyces sp. BI20]|uniref:DUF6542 domain-containing protein n=1 Tax=Streptomyces sp. BI20 TaxID=3403460 RepID=UPI003C769C79
MEHYTTRSPHHPPRPRPRDRSAAALPVQAGGRPAAAVPRRPTRAPRANGARALTRGSRRFPRPRLTGLGGGLFGCAAMLLVAGIAWLLFDSSLFAYGLLFLPVAAALALWIRPADLITAPISAPIAFAVGTWPIAGGSGGIGGQVMGVVTALSLHAGWLYAGTLIAALITVARRAVLSNRRRPSRRAGAAA